MLVVCLFHTTHLVPEPLHAIKVNQNLWDPLGRILFTGHFFTASTKWGHVHSSLPRPGGLGALVWVAAACTAVSLQFVLVVEDGEPLSQQLYW